jgi:hypothetical protein
VTKTTEIRKAATSMPLLNGHRIRAWLEEHNWTIGRLAEECSAMGDDTFPAGTLRNVVNGIDPMRPGRIRVICRVTARYGDGIPYDQLVEDDNRG